MDYNPVFELAEKFVNQTDKTLFVTGKAGTGKTTFLRHIVESTHKKCVVAAPTGIAAINAGGVTLHSLLQLPMLPFLPTSGSFDQNIALTKKTLFMVQKMGRDKIKLLNELELLIIDEASMLRADTLDCIDTILKARRNSNEPFGGLQILFIGDLFQLPPVVRREEEALLRDYYASSYFFSAEVMQNNQAICIELDKVYRQQDDFFVNILNEVRDSRLKSDHLEILNERYNPMFEPDSIGDYITVTSHNQKADEINQRNLARLSSPEKLFEAEKTGEFFVEPVDPQLKLKEGAQIIFIKNDKQEAKRYYNGKLGIIDKINEKGITVTFPKENTSLLLEKEVWENKRVEFNSETDEIEEKILGTYTQYPIKLAWAITIHKSQGLTFDKAIVDAGDSFAPGQVYVALSRLRTLEGMVLKSKITQDAIKTDATVKEFAKTFDKLDTLDELLEEARKEYIPKLLYKVFDYDKLIESFQFFIDSFNKRKFDGLAEASTWAMKQYQPLTKHGQTAAKFVMQLQQIINQQPTDYELLHERTQKAEEYFTNELDALILELQLHKAKYAIKKNTKAYTKDLEVLIMLAKKQRETFQKATLLTKVIAGETEYFQKFLEKAGKPEKEQPKPKADKVDTKAVSFELFQTHKDVAKVAELRGLVAGTIVGHLTHYVTLGQIEATELLPQDRLDTILNVIYLADGPLSSKQIKDQLDESFSYNDIAVAQAHLAREKGEK